MCTYQNIYILIKILLVFLQIRLLHKDVLYGSINIYDYIISITLLSKVKPNTDVHR